MTQLQRLVDHCVWANQVWISFIRENCPTDEYLLKMMTHILLGEQAWFQQIEGVEVKREIWTPKPITELQEIHRQHTGRYSALLQQDLGRIIAYQRFSGDRYQSPISDILTHLCLHGTHHRGQMATYAARNGMSVTNTDFINYCRSNNL